MANYGGSRIGSDNITANITEPWATAPVSTKAVAWADTPSALDPARTFAGLWEFVDNLADLIPAEHLGHVGNETVATYDWFEHFHVIPRKFEFGNILTAQQEPIEVYSAFRDEDHLWLSLINNAGDGVSLIGQPSLPVLVPHQTGIQMELLVDTSGDPSVDTTLDFVFDVGTTEVPISLQRVVLFPVIPESGYLEYLEFATEILEHEDATEQRISLRKNPRQMFDWKLVVEDGRARARLENYMFEWQRRVFGIPIWHELTRLTSAATIGDTVINVGETDYRDFREGGLVLVYTSDTVSDVGTIAVGGITGTTITLQSGVLNNYAAGVMVVPLRTAVVKGQINGRRYPTGVQEMTIQFRVTDNDIDIADTTGWTMLNSKVVLDDSNAITGTMSETFDQQVTIIDNVTGQVFQTSGWASNRRTSNKTFWTATVQGLWEVRQLLHALRGRQVSFYLPTFAKDFQPTSQLNSGGSTMNIENVGYTQFVRNRQPKNIIRVTFNDGTAPLIRTITTSSEIDDDNETLTLDGVWPSNYPVSVVDRVMYVEEVRFSSDTIRIQHTIGQLTVRIQAPVVTVFE
jgi:hypothetical protein